MKENFKRLLHPNFFIAILLAMSIVPMMTSDAKAQTYKMPPEALPNTKGVPVGSGTLVEAPCFNGGCACEANNHFVFVYLNIPVPDCYSITIDRIPSTTNDTVEILVKKQKALVDDDRVCKDKNIMTHREYTTSFNKKEHNKLRIQYDNQFVDLNIPKDFRYGGRVY